MALMFGGLTIPPAAALNGVAGRNRGLAAAGARSVVPLTYGEDRLGALILNVLPAGTGSNTLLVQCLWGYGGDGVSDVRLNNLALPAGSTVTSYSGEQTTPNAALVAAFAAQGITYTDTLQGYQYSVVAMPVRSFDGTLNITGLVRGRKLYDQRLDSTSGGSGPHRFSDPSTWAWSNNPALALVDFCGNTVYGAGMPTYLYTSGLAADACDTLIGSPAEKRRMLGVTFTQPASVADVAEALRAYAGCFLATATEGAQLYVALVPDLNAAPVAGYSHASGEIAAISRLSKRDSGNLPTAVEVIYTDTTAVPWREASATASLPGAGISRPWRLSQVRMPGVHRGSQALREAIERLNKLNNTNLSCSLEVFDVGIRHELGDIISVSHPLGLTGQPFRVLDVSMPGPGRWALDLAIHSASSYSTSVAAPAGSVDPSPVARPGPPGAVQDLTGSVAKGIITWSWVAATERDWAETRLRQGGSDWASASPLWAGRATGLVQRVTVPDTYVMRARHVLIDGQESTTAAVAGVLVTAADLVVDGQDGVDGVDGEQGPQGAQGAQGLQGPQGAAGTPGGFMDYVFRRAAAQPATPTGDGTPSGWADAPPAPDGNPLWTSIGEKTASNTLVGAWSAPAQLDGDGIELQYSVDGSTGWHSTFTTGDLFARQRIRGGAWTSAYRIVGEQGPAGAQGSQGQQGPQGASVIALQLSTYSVSLTAASDGVLDGPQARQATITVREGAADVSSLWSYSLAVSDSGINASRSGLVVTVTAMPTALDVGSVTITATRSGYPDQNAVLAVVKVKRAAPSAGPVFPGTIWADHIVLSPNDGYAYVEFRPNGEVWAKVNGVDAKAGDWYLPNTSGIGSGYRVRFDQVSGDAITDNNAASAEVISINRYVGLLVSSDYQDFRSCVMSYNLTTLAGVALHSGLLNMTSGVEV